MNLNSHVFTRFATNVTHGKLESHPFCSKSVVGTVTIFGLTKDYRFAHI